MAMYGQMSSNENPSEIQGICPDGWHLPSDAEWLQLENYLIENQYNYNYTQDGNQIAKALASEDADWDSCELPGSPGFFKNKNNSSGFSAYDTRMYSSIDDSWFYYDSSGNFWSSTAQNIDDAISRRIQYNKKALISNQTDKQAALSIRCIKTEPASVISDTHNNYEIFPNPSEGIFTIQWDASFNESRVQIEIYNSRGELISNNNILIGADYKIDLSHQPDGVYFTKITQKQNVSIEKIIKIE